MRLRFGNPRWYLERRAQDPVPDQRRRIAPRRTTSAGRSKTPSGTPTPFTRRARRTADLAPDLIVGHSGFGSTVFLPELFPGVPIINYFEYFYRPHDSDMDFRPDFPPEPRDFLRARARNAMILLDLQTCRAGYSPTHFQRNLFPDEYRSKIDVVFDGVDTEVFCRRPERIRLIAGREIPASTRIVTYVSRGFESMRGFDIFMRAARVIAREYPDVLFVVVGSDRVCYGGDEKHIRHTTFREHVLAGDDYDLSKFLFTGLVPVSTLVDILSLSDLHIYLTVPFVLSWSLMNALACGCTVLASNTAPVVEMIADGENGLLVDFFDVEGLARRAVEVLRDPSAFRVLGERGAALVAERYALASTLPRLLGLFERVVSGKTEDGRKDRGSADRPRVNSGFAGPRYQDVARIALSCLARAAGHEYAEARPRVVDGSAGRPASAWRTDLERTTRAEPHAVVARLAPDRTTVHTEPPTVGEADDTEATTGGEADDTEALTGDVTDNGPATTGTWTGALESRDPSLSSQALGFELRGDASEPGETADLSPGLTTTVPAPLGESIDPDETVDVIQDDRTTPPTEDMPAERPKSRKPGGGQIGPDLPGYVILEVIGRGGMGVVYKARQIGLDRLVALKMVLAGAHASPEELARFAIESQAVAQLQHPGIVQIHEVGEHDGLPYFSLEFVAGGSLAKKIGGKPQPTREAAEMVRDLALAMGEAHRRNIIHRDLKPANVLLTPDGQPKITDFGLAKRLDADSGQTHTGAIMGTPSYMAPEQAWGQTHQIGPLTDLYALGAILYEMLVGRPPFQGASPLETLELVRMQEPVPPTRLQPKIPVDLETICLKCLQKDPAKRYADAGALADDLQRFLDARPILARPVGPVERLARWCRRNPKVAALTGTVAVLLVTVTTVSSYAAISLDRLNKAESAAQGGPEQ